MIQQTWNQSVWVSYGTVVPASNRVNGNNITVIPLNFDLTAAGNGATLPVELLNFDAQFEDGVVKILWTTASETNNDYFTIEKSLDGINFEALTMVPGAGNSNHFISYTAIDKNPLQGTSYYRLKQTDFNGAYEIFEPVVVKNDASGTADSASLTVFPNPSNGQDLSIKLSGFGPNTEVYIVVSDLLGKELYSGKATTNADGFITTPIEQQLASGTYIVAGFANGTVYNKKIIVR
jgi:hypothetical protein